MLFRSLTPFRPLPLFVPTIVINDVLPISLVDVSVYSTLEPEFIAFDTITKFPALKFVPSFKEYLIKIELNVFAEVAALIIVVVPTAQVFVVAVNDAVYDFQ